MTARCANCGLPAHRYGTNDRNHEPDKTACINGLRHQLRKLTEAARAVTDPASRALEHDVYTNFCLKPDCDRDLDDHLGRQLAELQAALDEIEDFR